MPWRDYVESSDAIRLAKRWHRNYFDAAMKILSTLAVGILALFLGVLTLRPVQGEDRIWTQASSGRSIEGAFVKVEGENVHILKTGGGVIPVPVKMLSKEDQDFIATQTKPVAAATGEPVSLTLSGMHLCCGACEKRVVSTVGGIEGATVAVDRDAGTAKLDAPDGKTAQAAVDALADAGFYGKSDSNDVEFKAGELSDKKVKTITINNVHLCCGGCVKAADKAITAVDGVEAHTAENKAESFEVTGRFSPAEVIEALREAGMNGVIATPAE